MAELCRFRTIECPTAIAAIARVLGVCSRAVPRAGSASALSRSRGHVEAACRLCAALWQAGSGMPRAKTRVLPAAFRDLKRMGTAKMHRPPDFGQCLSLKLESAGAKKAPGGHNREPVKGHVRKQEGTDPMRGEAATPEPPPRAPEGEGSPLAL